MIAFCGLVCDSCPVHLATFESDKVRQNTLRESIARLCREKYGLYLERDDINDCDGCKANNGKLFTGSKDCVIRSCATLKELDNCALCPDYVCENLRNHFIQNPESRVRLEEIRNRL